MSEKYSRLPKVDFRLTPADREHLTALREHVRKDDPWASKSDAIRAGLEIAANVIRSQQTA